MPGATAENGYFLCFGKQLAATIGPIPESHGSSWQWESSTLLHLEHSPFCQSLFEFTGNVEASAGAAWLASSPQEKLLCAACARALSPKS